MVHSCIIFDVVNCCESSRAEEDTTLIYLDNAATTGIHAEVAKAMQPYLSEFHGNPSSIHELGRRSRRAIDEARSHVAQLLGCEPKLVTFTSGGTESIHAAILGALLSMPPSRRHVISSAVEHHAVLHTLEFAAHLGATVTFLTPDKYGRIDVNQVLSAIREDTGLVSVMRVNNELGTVLPVYEIAEQVKARFPSILVHSDMVQALPSERIHLAQTMIDLASVSGHKIHGPKGVGALYIRPGTPWTTVMRGGDQESKRRGGTENVSGIVGFGVAAKLQLEQMEERLAHIDKVNRRFWSVLRMVEGVSKNSPADAIPNILNLRIKGVPSDVLLMRLDLAGVAASAGSACTAGALTPSHVLKACGYDEAQVNNSVRFSFSSATSLMASEAAARITRKEIESIREQI
jgi:cysteine desulfurase